MDARRFTRGVLGMLLAGSLLTDAAVSPSALAGPSALGAEARSVHYGWSGFFRVPGHKVPVTYVVPVVEGPELFAGIGVEKRKFAPATLAIEARGVGEITIDTVGGVRSTASVADRVGFLPRNLMGGLSGSPSGGTARLEASMRYLSIDDSIDAGINRGFGSHGWENRTQGTITLDRIGARKVLGLTDAEAGDFASYFASHREQLEQRWWWWLLDEGGDTHVGGVGRLDVRPAFDTPLQMWRNDLALLDDDPDHLVLRWTWDNMAGDMLWSRWLSEGLGMGYEPNSFSRLDLDMTIGSSGSDLDADLLVDNALVKVPGANRWTFETQGADLAGLANEYRNEGTYESPAGAYDGKRDLDGRSYGRPPTAWNLRDGDALEFDLSDAPQVTLKTTSVEPGIADFPGQISSTRNRVVFEGPLDMEGWSAMSHAADWAGLADASHPGGLLPRGVPAIWFSAKTGWRTRWRLKDPKPFEAVSSTDSGRSIPAFPEPSLDEVPTLPSSGRTVRFDIYDFFDVPMPADRWEQLERNGYARQLDDLSEPVRYRTGGTTYSGARLRIDAHRVPEITIDTIGGGPDGSSGVGFFPRNLMGGSPAGVGGGTLSFRGHLQYGSRARESVYRLQQWWGYYGWENFLDAQMTFDKAALQKVFGITGAQADGFHSWFAANEGAVETAWRQWLYREWRRSGGMTFFNFPLTIWDLDLELVSAGGGQVVMKMTVFNEALDVLYGRWFNRTVMPDFESSLSDLHLEMTVGPGHSDLRADLVLDWSLYQDGNTWVFEPSLGDEPALANEYRDADSPGMAYFGASDGSYTYDYTPSAWDLRAGEQLNIHFGGAGLRVDSLEPPRSEFPSKIDVTSERVSFTGPLDLRNWSRGWNRAAWNTLGGLLPWGEPYVTFR